MGYKNTNFFSNLSMVLRAWIKKIIGLLINGLYNVLPLKKDFILIASQHGESSGHLKALSQVLKTHKVNNVYTIYQNSDSKKQPKKNSFKALKKLLKAKTIIYTHNPEDIFIAIPKRVYKVNIWHGMPIKPIGYQSKIERKWLKNKNKFYDKNDTVVVNNSQWVDVFEKGWRISKNKIKPLGSIISKYLEIKNVNYNTPSRTKKQILYAPTFRNNGTDLEIISETIKILNTISNINVILKPHPKVLRNNLKEFDDFRDNRNLFDLFLEADILITDYSSIFYEFLQVKNNCILYQPDLKNYINQNGELLNIVGPIDLFVAYDGSQLVDILRQLLKKDLNTKPQLDDKFDLNRFLKLIDA